MLRLKGEKVKLVAWSPMHDYDEEEEGGIIVPYMIPKDLKHGDIIYDPEGYRAEDMWIIDGKGKDRYLRPVNGDAGGIITKSIASKIVDPVEFYYEALDDQIITIELDTKIHQSSIQKQTGGRKVDDTVRVFLDCGWYVAILPNNEHIELNKETPDKYLDKYVEEKNVEEMAMDDLKQEIKDLRLLVEHYKYRPPSEGGDGYSKSKDHFES